MHVPRAEIGLGGVDAAPRVGEGLPELLLEPAARDVGSVLRPERQLEETGCVLERELLESALRHAARA